MHIERIYFQQNFRTHPGIDPFLFGTIGMGVFINEGENVEDAINEAKKLVGEYCQKNTQYPSHPVTEIRDIQIDDTPKPTSLIDDINSCNDIKVLESYRLIVKGNATLRQVYNHKLEELNSINKPSK